jgi:hypothetical protein
MYCRRVPARKSRYALSNASLFRVVPISSFAIIIITPLSLSTTPPHSYLLFHFKEIKRGAKDQNVERRNPKR